MYSLWDLLVWAEATNVLELDDEGPVQVSEDEGNDNLEQD